VGVTLTLSSRWPYFFWALVVLTLAGIALACLNLMNPRWTRFSATLRLGVDCYTWGLVFWVFRANLLQSLSASSLSSSDADSVVKALNFWMANSAIWVLVIGLVVLAFDVRRILRIAPIA
jgi:hypothetical protein